ncbi:NAD(P)-dependent alcohol dehydrogenase [Rhizohabitans arisaemae]|uniref:NAD(P)-dependent alcohol dehydrogenase n=1 Tax=Rhizohabitans arisaemae TaxID=2720610 RepID=UPI0024B0ECFA|nr:NAD(P)-dependent alcohol dehydrogenase [Rhizohabitans arisaemae]
MHAIVYRKYGGPEVLRYTEVDKPSVGDDGVLVRVHATSINFGDLAAIHGVPRIGRLGFGIGRPKKNIPGRAIAGTVEAVGSTVTRFRVGDEVLGEMNQRGFAEYVVAPESHLVTKPAGVTFEQAATLPVAATTALLLLRGEAGPGRTVLVNGASGGVGTFAVQVAKVLGAEVTGVCSTRNVELVRSIGADHVIDYTREDVTRGTARFDVVVDLVGNHRLADIRRILVPKGIFLPCSGTGGPVLGPMPRLLAAILTSPFVSQRLSVRVQTQNAEDLAYLAGLVESGQITPVIQARYPLSETAEAIRFLEADHARGKVVLTV